MITRPLLVGLLVALLASLVPSIGSAAAPAPSFYAVSALDAPGGPYPFDPYDLNDAGQAYGTVQCVPDCDSATAAIVDGAGVRRVAVGPVVTGGHIGTLNEAGWATGAAYTGDMSIYRRSNAFLYRDGRAVDLGTLPGDDTSVGFGLNDAGWVVGESVALTPVNSIASTRAALWRGGEVIDLGTLGGGAATARAVNNRGQIVGSSYTGGKGSCPYCGDYAAFLWQDGRMANLGTLGGGNAFPRRINDAGQVVGYSGTADGATRAFLWQGGAMRDLGTLGGRDSTAWGLNDAGQIVGRAATGDYRPDRAFLVDSRFGGAILDLNDFIPANSGWTLVWATAINNRGQIVGVGEYGGQRRAFLLTPRFPDLSPADPRAAAILALAARGIIRGYEDGTVGPDDPVLRAQAAGLVSRAAGWGAEDWPDATFPDQGAVDDDLWRDVRTLAHYGVARGYADGTYNPAGVVTHQQFALLTARALVTRGVWTLQPDTAPYPNLPDDTARARDDRRMIATYVYYAGPIPEYPTGQPWADWDQPATRGWAAEVLWRALGTTPTP